MVAATSMLGLAFILMGLTGAPVSLGKTATLITDPVNGAVAPKALPGATVEYAIVVTNTSGFPLDSGAVVVTDALPASVKLFVKDLGAAGSGPFVTSQGAVPSGLSTTYLSLSSATDEVDFSNNGGASFAYSPVADASGCDPAVTNVRIRTHGTAALGGVYKIRFRVAVR